MRVALLTHEPFYPPSGGGSAEAVYLVREMVARGHQVEVFGPRIDDHERVTADFGIRLRPFQRWEMGRYTRARNLKYLAYPFFLERMVAEAARRQPFELLLSQHAISAVAAGRLKRRLGVPVVMNFLDYLTAFMETWPVWLMPPPALAVLKKFELGMPAKYGVDGVLTVSDVLADYVVGAGYPKEKVLPIYYGYDAQLFAFDEAAAKRRAEGPPTVVMHGSLDHHHLGRVAQDALAAVWRERPEVVFKFVGRRTAPLAQLEREMTRRCPGRALVCTGFVPYAEVARELRSASVGLVPYEESSGTHCAFVAKLVEYLGLGLPVASTALQGVCRYFVDEPLVRFAPFDGEILGQTILGWLAEPPAQRLALAGPASERVRTQLDWRVLCRRAVDRLEEVAKHARKSL